MTFSAADQAALLPALLVLIAGLLAVGVDVFVPGGKSRWPLVALSFTGVLGAAWVLVDRLSNGSPAVRGFGGSLVLDDMTAFVSLAILAATGLLLAASDVDTRRRHVPFGEYYGLLLFAASSMMLLVGSNDLLMIFLTLETLSIALYVLTGITRRNPRSNEAAVKYLVTGAFATGFLVMGMALLYGATGTLQLDAMGKVIAAGNASSVLATGFGLLLVGFAFKIGAAPFHMWVPDVYEGAPTTTTAFMSVTVKAAGVGALIRILLTVAGTRPDLWADLLWWMAVATMIVGNLLALQQQSVKRMLAFSSVAHTGYALVALATMHGTDGTFRTEGASAALFYLLVYTFMTLGAFVFLVYIGHEVRTPGRDRVEWQDGEHIDDLAGLAARRPWSALGMTILLLSLGGMPPTAGFFGKFYLFQTAVAQGHVTLAVIGVIASLVSLYYYLRVVVFMYMKEPVTTDERPDGSVGFVVFTSVAATLALGILPGVFLAAAVRSIVDL